MALVVASSAAAPAVAAPITLTSDPTAGKPTVAVDADGTGHFGWKSGSGLRFPTINYCRVPRGGTSCALTRTFTPDDREAFGPVQVLIPEPGHIQLVSYRCCNEGTYFAESTDSGTTWSEPRDIGTGTSEWVSNGPGQFVISTLTESIGGVRFQAMPLNGGRAEGYAVLSDGNAGQWYPGGVGMVDATTPIVAYTDLENTFYRAYDPTKPPEYNDAANWRAPHELAGEDEPVLASGSGGVFLATRTGKPGAWGLRVRRLNGQTVTFGQQRDLLVDPAETDPIFHALDADAGGGATVAWIRNDCFANNTQCDSLRVSRTADGGDSWTRPVTLVAGTDDGGFNLEVGTAPDHGGWVVYDGNNRGPIRAAAIPKGTGSPSGGGSTGGGGCKTKVQITPKVLAEVSGGCFAQDGPASAKRWKTGGQVRVNGIDFVPGPGGRVTVDQAANRVIATGDVDQKAGNVVLNKGPLSWDLDKATKFTKLDESKINLLGFPVTGEATVTFGDLTARVELNVRLPAPFGDVTGKVVLKPTQKGGFKPDGLAIDVPSASIGMLQVKDLHVVFSEGFSTFEGSAKFLLPPSGAKEIHVGFGFKNGEFLHAEIPFYSGPPFPFQIYGPYVSLDAIGFGVSVANGFRLNGDVWLSAGPGIHPIKVKGGFIFALPADKDYAEFTATGNVGIYDLELSSSKAYFNTDGLFTFQGLFGLGSDDLGVHGSVNGGLNIDAGTFYASSDATACLGPACAGASTIFSSVGFAACADIKLVSVGVGYYWGKKFHFYWKGCDTDDYKPGGFRRRQAGGGGTVQLAAGMPQGAIRVTGSGGVPLISVTGPDGTTIAGDPAAPTRPVVQDGILLIPDAADGTVQVIIAKPAGGAWTIASTGGAPIAKVETAKGLPDTVPSGRLTGSGRHKRLVYSIKGLAGGRTVRFIERSPQGLVHQLGTAKGARGVLRFTALDGPAGTRTVEALVVARDRLPLSATVLARFRAPGPLRPGRPRALRVRRTPGRATITWRRAPGAVRYEVLVRLTDGRHLQLLQSRRRLVVRSVERRDRVRVTVRGVSRLGKRGVAARRTS